METSDDTLPVEATGFIRYAAKAIGAAIVPPALAAVDAFGRAIGVDIPIDVDAATATTVAVISAGVVYAVRNGRKLLRRNR